MAETAKAHPLDEAGETLTGAKAWVAQSVLENRRALEALRDSLKARRYLASEDVELGAEALGEVLEALGRWDEASEAFLRTLQKHPPRFEIVEAEG